MGHLPEFDISTVALSLILVITRRNEEKEKEKEDSQERSDRMRRYKVRGADAHVELIGRSMTVFSFVEKKGRRKV